MNETAEVKKVNGKKPANLTRFHLPKLEAIEPEKSELYLQAMGFRKDKTQWQNPADMDLPTDFKVTSEGGMVQGTVGDDILRGYRLVAWLIFKSKARGIHPVKIGALVMAGVYTLNVFTELDGFNTDSNNDFRKTMEIAEHALAISAIGSSENGTPADHSHLKGFASSEVAAEITDHAETMPPEGQAHLTIPGHPDVTPERSVKTQQALVASKDLEEDYKGDDVDFANRPDDGHQTSQTSRIDDEPELQDPEELAAIVHAFNGAIPSERKCLEKIKVNNKNQFCTEILVGRLVLKKTEELKSGALLKKWKNDEFPKECDKHFFSRCVRYAQFDQSLKSRRRLPLGERDLKLFTKKAMLLIGGYNKKNAAELFDDVIVHLDRGERLSEDSVRDLVQKYKAKVTKPKQDEEETLPPVPRTIQNLFELPEKWLSPAGRKHMAEFQELLEAIEPEMKDPAKEAAVVLPLVKIFTVL